LGRGLFFLDLGGSGLLGGRLLGRGLCFLGLRRCLFGLLCRSLGFLSRGLGGLVLGRLVSLLGGGLLRSGLLRRGFLGGLRGGFLGLDRGFEFRAAYLPFGDLGLVEQEIDDLVFIERGAKLGLGHRVLADIFDEPFAVLRPILLRGLLNQ